jgi:hypothetical protein
MMTEDKTADATPGPETGVDTPRALSPAAKRALAEAAARRDAQAKAAVSAPKEFQGRDGPDPVRYGDWESRGIASDF